MNVRTILLSLAFFVFACFISNAQENDDKKAPAIKQIKVESSKTQTELTLYGILDSTTFRIMGITRGGWDTNVKCFKRKADKEPWFSDSHYKYCYKGMDTQYRWTIMIFNDGSIRVHQNKKGVRTPTDIYGGEYPMEQFPDIEDQEEPLKKNDNKDQNKEDENGSTYIYINKVKHANQSIACKQPLY